MRRKTAMVLLLLLAPVAACQRSLPPAATGLPGATVFSPTLTPLPTATATPAPTPLPTWTLLFHGAPCAETESECVVAGETPIAYYAIESDGSGLEQVTEFPSGLLPPEGSPRPYGEPRLSPDGRLLAYPAAEGLYVVDTVGGGGEYIFRPEGVSGVNPVGPVCWLPDGEGLSFVVRRWGEGRWHNEFYRIGVHGEEARLLFTLADLGSFIWTGVCSPDGREMAFAINPYGHKETGVYVVDLESGAWRRILQGYMVDLMRAPMDAALRAQTEALRASGKIIFAGVPCRLRGPDCAPVPGDPLYYYAVNWDGSGLENVLAIPALVVPPAGAPAGAFEGPVEPSPDGSKLAYADQEGVHIVEVSSGETRLGHPEMTWYFERFVQSYRQAPVCWTADGEGYAVLTHWRGRFNRIARMPLGVKGDEEVRPLLFHDEELEILTWACLSERGELAFSLHPQGGEKRGLYVLDLESGEQRRILEDYEVVSVGLWPSPATPQYLFAPLPGPVWRVHFQGAPCARLGEPWCDFGFPGSEGYISYYSFYSDGTGLQEIAEFPQSFRDHRLSPDGSFSTYSLLYDSVEGSAGLYVKDLSSGEARYLVGPEDIPGVTSAHRLVPACWTPDGSKIRFYVRFQENEHWKGAFYSIDLNGENLQRLLASPGLEGWESLAIGACLPDSQEMLFPIDSGNLTGLYLVNLERNEWRPILRGYSIHDMVVKSVATP